MTDLDPTKYTLGPITAYRSNNGYGWEINLGRRLQLNTRKNTTRMWPKVTLGADENCNRTVYAVLWPLGYVVVWWEPKWRTTPCDRCKGEWRAEGLCEECGSRPCWCDELREIRS